MGVYWFKLVIAFPILMFFLWGVSKWAQQTSNFSSKQSNLSIVDQLRVSPKATLQVIRVASQYFLISVTDQNVHLLKELSADDFKMMEVSALEIKNLPELIQADVISKVKERLSNRKG